MIVIETEKFKEAQVSSQAPQQQAVQQPIQQKNVRQDPMYQKLQSKKQRLGIDNRLMTMLSNPQYGPMILDLVEKLSAQPQVMQQLRALLQRQA